MDDFNPLAPCGARRPAGSPGRRAREFQSTCSVRSKTWTQESTLRMMNYFNPLAPCGARPNCCLLGLRPLLFQSTCSVRSKTQNGPAFRRWGSAFQSTCSVRSKTTVFQHPVSARSISIHLLRAEQDYVLARARVPNGISIHLLRAEQDAFNHMQVLHDEKFQSTCSVRSKTLRYSPFCFTLIISIHLLRAEQDMENGRYLATRWPFQSTCSVRSKTPLSHAGFA